MKEAATPLEAMALFEALLRASGKPLGAHAKPIAFIFPTGEWSFEPARVERPFAPAPAQAPALRLRCTPQLISRLLEAPQFYLGEGEQLAFSGDPTALQALIDVLQPAGAGGRVRS